MALPNVTGEIIAQGFNCHVRVGTNASDAETIALVASFQANEDFQVQEATCLGNLGPVALDPQGYTCSLTIDGFLPFKKILDGAMQYADGGKIALMDIMPTRAKFMDAGAIQKIAYLDFYNKKAGKVLKSFEGVLITSGSINVDGNAYARNGVQARALSAA
ncbi:MAG: hypothetical protein LBD55_02130 [Treponema sp.]|jgi:hypothetical protein|nr:hypothetical protein [Treponema sp.]